MKKRRRIYNPKTKTYYIIKRRGEGTTSILGRYSEEKGDQENE